MTTTTAIARRRRTTVGAAVFALAAFMTVVPLATSSAGSPDTVPAVPVPTATVDYLARQNF